MKLFIIISSLLFSSIIYSEDFARPAQKIKNEKRIEEDLPKHNKETIPVSKQNTIQEQAFKIHSTISKRILILSNSVDSFFGETDSLEKKNGTTLRVFNLSSKKESTQYDNKFNFKFKLRLPNLQKRLQITIERSDKENATVKKPGEEILYTPEDRKDNSLQSSVSIFLKDIATFKSKFTAGVRLSIPPNPFINLKVYRDYGLKSWVAKTEGNIFWRLEEGLGQNANLSFDRNLSENFLLRLANGQSWLFNDRIINTSHGPTLYHRIDHKRAISYNFRANTNDINGFKFSSYVGNVVYRQNITSTWFYFEIIPQLEFNRENNFKSEPSIYLKVELFFGSV